MKNPIKFQRILPEESKTNIEIGTNIKKMEAGKRFILHIFYCFIDIMIVCRSQSSLKVRELIIMTPVDEFLMGRNASTLFRLNFATEKLKLIYGYSNIILTQ